MVNKICTTTSYNTAYLATVLRYASPKFPPFGRELHTSPERQIV